MPNDDARLILLPGLGADARMFEPQRAAFPRLEVVEWIEPRRRETLADYAGRLAERVDPSAPFVLGGSSFGGPVALEMAKRLRPRAVVLIGSFRSAGSIPWPLRCLAGLAARAPGLVLRPMHAVTCRFTYPFGDLNATQHAMLVDMTRAADPRFLRWGGGALAQWPGAAGEFGVPVHSIHGGADRVIPCRRVRPDVVVSGGGHLVNVTHAEAVNAFLARVVSGGA